MSTAEQGLHIRNSKVVTFTFTEGKVFNLFNSAPCSNMSPCPLIPCVPLRSRSTNVLSYRPQCIATTKFAFIVYMKGREYILDGGSCGEMCGQ